MINHLFQVFLTALAPITEARGAIPLGIYYNIPFWQVFLISIIGNMIPVFFLLIFLEKISNFLSNHFTFFKRFFNWLFKTTKSNHSSKFEKYRDFALVTLTAIPLPFTGAYTASICAFVFNIEKKKAFSLILLGVIIASIIVSVISCNLI